MSVLEKLRKILGPGTPVAAVRAGGYMPDSLVEAAPAAASMPVSQGAELSDDAFRRELFPASALIAESELERVIAAAARAAIPVRIDLSRGFTVAAHRALQFCAKAGIAPLVMFPPVATGEAVYIREGRCWWVADFVALLRCVQDVYGAKLGFLADPAQVISRVLCQPDIVWSALAEQLGAAGIEVTGIGCSLRKARDTRLNLLWCYRANGRLKGQAIYKLLPQLDFECWEWGYSTSAGSDPKFRDPLDAIAHVVAAAAPGSDETFARSLGVVQSAQLDTRIVPAGADIVHTDRSGWCLIEAAGERTLSAAELIDRLARSPADGVLPAIIAIDPGDVHFGDVAAADLADSDRRFRVLPFPYTHYLAINSDIDWTDGALLPRVCEFFHRTLGLPFAASLYLESSDPRWPSWTHLDDTLRRAWRRGAIDTVHGITYSHDTLEWRAADFDAGHDCSCAWDGDLDLRGYTGLWVESASESSIEAIELRGTSRAEALVVPCSRVLDDPDNGLRYSLFDFQGKPGSVLSAVRGLRLLGADLDADAIVAVRTCAVTTPVVAAIAQALIRDDLRPVVFTSHGGGEGTRRYGSCVDRAWRGIAPEEARLAFDRPESPWYCLDELKRIGIGFVNPNGNAFSVPFLVHRRDLLKPETAQDGAPVYEFSRFMSQRHSELDLGFYFSHRKHAATAQGFAANVYDIVQRMCWAGCGTGAIIYTHLGHRLGSQLGAELRWNDEMQAALRHYAALAHRHDGDERPSVRIWAATASQVLAFAALMRGLPQHTCVDGNVVHIESWLDEKLGRTLGCLRDHGSSWLHGATIYVPDPYAAKVFVDGSAYECFTRNSSDQSGSPSITLVARDDVECLSPERLAVSGAVGAELAVGDCGDLTNVTHISFRAQPLLPCSWSFTLETREGAVFQSGDASSPWWLEQTQLGAWTRIVLPVHDAPGARAMRGSLARLGWRLTAQATERAAEPVLLVEDVLLHRAIPKGSRGSGVAGAR